MRASQHPEAAFLAAMTASATHEVRNVLAIIKESAGLIGDMAHASGERGAMDREKLFRALDRIETQVKRGADLLTNLNRLSHTLDHDLVTVDLGEEVEQMLFRGQRFARKRGQQVAAGNRTEVCNLTVNPLHLHMILFAVLERCLETMPEGSTVTVRVHQDPGARMVEYRGTPVEGKEVSLGSGTKGLADLEELAGPLGATVVPCEPGYGIRILFPHGTAV